MSPLSDSAAWYLAEIVLQITVEGDPRNAVHTNLVLVRADSPEGAYDKAIELGVQGEISYPNPAGKLVRIRFRGLRELKVIHDDLEHGAELSYTEHVDMDELAIQKHISLKKDLGVFAVEKPRSGPDYTSRDVAGVVASLQSQ